VERWFALTRTSRDATPGAEARYSAALDAIVDALGPVAPAAASEMAFRLDQDTHTGGALLVRLFADGFTLHCDDKRLCAARSPSSLCAYRDPGNLDLLAHLRDGFLPACLVDLFDTLPDHVLVEDFLPAFHADYLAHRRRDALEKRRGDGCLQQRIKMPRTSAESSSASAADDPPSL